MTFLNPYIYIHTEPEGPCSEALQILNYKMVYLQSSMALQCNFDEENLFLSRSSDAQLGSVDLQ